jgi:hypothetical protein
MIAFAVLAAAALAAEEAAPAPEVKGADVALVQNVRLIGERCAQTLGVSAPLSLLALRAPEEVRLAEARRRAERELPAVVASARGRAWADLGFGTEDDPAAIALALARDLPGLSFDGDRARLLVDPTRLVDDEGNGDPASNHAASLMLATGVAPDEPVVAHYVTHAMTDPPAPTEPQTTDRTLARGAWAEGEANLAALLLLFGGVGLENEVVGSKIRPEDVLAGRLVSEAIRSDRPIVARLTEWMYLDGFASVAALVRQVGMQRLPAERARRATTRDVIHLDRPAALPLEFGKPPEPEAAGLALVDRDSLGEAGITAWVSMLTGKDNLGMIAGDGWAGDALWRFEGSGGGVTLWETKWVTEDEAKDFAYAVERCLQARFPGEAVAGAGDEPRSLARADRVYRLERKGASVTIRVASPEWDAKLDAAAKKKGAPSRSPRPKP